MQYNDFSRLNKNIISVIYIPATVPEKKIVISCVIDWWNSILLWL